MTSVIEVARPAAPERAVVTDADVLERAADLLGEWDWCQGSARCGEAICAEGAVWLAVGGTLPHRADVELPDAESLYFSACRATADFVGRDGLFEWNDEPGRTKTEVVALLRDVAARLRGEANA